MRYRVVHTTRYRYDATASLGHNQACLLPRDAPPQRCLLSAIDVTPEPALIVERRDVFGNRVHYFETLTPHQELAVTATSLVDTTAPSPLPPSPPWDRRPGPDAPALCEFMLPSPLAPLAPAGDALRDYARPSFPSGRPLLEAAAELSGRIHRDFRYDPQATTVSTPLEQVLRERRGVCQDFAHLFIACLRAFGAPARYVSGYLETLPPPGQAKLTGSDASHAWGAVGVDGLGWFDFDPTNDQRADERYVTVAWGRDYGDVTPLRGVVLGGGRHHLEVAVDVLRAAEAPS